MKNSLEKLDNELHVKVNVSIKNMHVFLNDHAVLRKVSAIINVNYKSLLYRGFSMRV